LIGTESSCRIDNPRALERHVGESSGTRQSKAGMQTLGPLRREQGPTEESVLEIRRRPKVFNDKTEFQKFFCFSLFSLRERNG
jgi:hypothetical protein